MPIKTSEKYDNFTFDEKEEIKSMIKDRINTKENGCWGWAGHIGQSGYASLTFNNEKFRVNRLIVTCFHDEEIGDYLALHKCDNPSCVNPEHIYKGTPKDNVQDCIERDRRADVNGEKNGNAILERDDVLEIYDMLEETNKSYEEISNKYGVKSCTIERIKNGRLWTELKKETGVTFDNERRSGSTNGNAKVDEDIVREIRKKYEYEDYSRGDLFDEYDISKWVIEKIIYNQSWKHVEV
jgi:hypothetical protein